MYLHCHCSGLLIQVKTPGRAGKSLTTQAYFRDKIPPGYESYSLSRRTQFANVRTVRGGGALSNGGRIVDFNMKMDVGVPTGRTAPVGNLAIFG